jgi:hypothetical protein
MLKQSLSLLFALGAFGLLSGCGGAAMSGDSGTNKGKKKDDAVAIDAAEPYVVTGAYLTCEQSPSDAKGGDAVGCSLMDGSGAKITPTAQNKVAFYKSVSRGAYQKPDKTNTASGHQAVFLGTSDEISKTRFIGTFANRYGVDEVYCDSVPCKKAVSSGPKPTYLQLYVDGLWRVDDGAINKAAATTLNTKNYCSNGRILFGQSPAANENLFVKIGSMFGVGTTKIETLGQLYAETAKFSRDKLDFKVGDGCIVLPLKRVGGEFPADGMSRMGATINKQRFRLILHDTPQNRVTVKEFVNDIPN